jgi:hypothetical protein
MIWTEVDVVYFRYYLYLERLRKDTKSPLIIQSRFKVGAFRKHIQINLLGRLFRASEPWKAASKTAVTAK